MMCLQAGLTRVVEIQLQAFSHLGNHLLGPHAVD